MIKLETRAPLIRFLQLLVVHHPSKRKTRSTDSTLFQGSTFKQKARVHEATRKKELQRKSFPPLGWMPSTNTKEAAKMSSNGKKIKMHSWTRSWTCPHCSGPATRLWNHSTHHHFQHCH